ncbi:hypothetical protein PPSQR21_032500 [Paenibacillus polymyxa SQR-21]|uniref:hypothetical protein n=1 Tax=Paenibacillus polymyxa TaxID=1406 RepID=UPI00042F518A|nr:hypothetical protein [Paenibacillus polymyxa]AHM66889.1 hypothetical protein PPSQR21_032500 [Paenibacillus polymyxa SQR-21]
MAALIGVIRGEEPGVIEYEGVRFSNTKKPAQIGDIVVCSSDIYWDIDRGDCFLIDCLLEGAASFKDNAGDVRAISGSDINAAGVYGVYTRDFNVYEPCEASTEALLAAQREELVKITANIAELEAKLADEKTLKIGDYARVIDAGCEPALNTGDIVVISEIDPDDDELTLGVHPVLNPKLVGWVRTCGKITPVEAKAAILAQVEAQFKEVA